MVNIHERLMAAMRSLDVLERDVRSCMAATRARFGSEHEITSAGTEERRREEVVSANLRVVLERRKELGQLWGLDLEESRENLETAEIERLLTPQRLRDMTVWLENKADNDSIVTSSRRTSSKPMSQKETVVSVEKKKLVEKRRRVRRRESSSVLYTPGHIFRIFDPQEAIARVTRNKIAVEVEDEDEESDQEEQLDEPLSRPLSVASTGSNITVYRPPTPIPNEVAETVPQATHRKKKEPLRWQGTSERYTSLRRRQTSPSLISIPPQDTVKSGRLDEEAEILGTTQGASMPAAVGSQQTSSTISLRRASDPSLLVKKRDVIADDANAIVGTITSTSLIGDQRQSVTNVSELTFATSDGTGLFVSDKRRPKRPSINVTEGMILGGSASRVYFPTPSPVVEDTPSAVPGRTIKAPGSSAHKRSKKRRHAPSITSRETVPVNDRIPKRGKGMIDVSDLVTAPSKRKRPSRATMKNGVGMLVGITSSDDAGKSRPLSWQAKGRGKGVTRAVPPGELARKSSMDGEK